MCRMVYRTRHLPKDNLYDVHVLNVVFETPIFTLYLFIFLQVLRDFFVPKNLFKTSHPLTRCLAFQQQNLYKFVYHQFGFMSQGLHIIGLHIKCCFAFRYLNFVFSTRVRHWKVTY